MNLFFIKTKRRVVIDSNIFMRKSKYSCVTYEDTWQKPNGEIYVKYTKFPPVDSGYNSIEIGGFNSYGHVLRKVEKCYVLSNNL